MKEWNPADLPSWLTREFYTEKVQRALTTVPNVRIREALGVSESYSNYIYSGKIIPHARHWLPLAELVGKLRNPS